MCKACMLDFMDKEIVSFLRGEVNWDLYESQYKKCGDEGRLHEEETVQEGQEKR